MRKTVLLLLSMMLIIGMYVSPVYASPINIVNDIFSAGGDNIENYGYDIATPGNSTVSVATTLSEDGVLKKALRLSDKVPGMVSSGVKIQKEFGEFKSGKIGFEIKFKMEIPEGAETDYSTMELCFLTEKGEKATRFRITRSPEPGIMRWDEQDNGTTNLGHTIEKDTWYRIKLIMDLDAKRVTGYFESDAFDLGSLLYPSLKFMAVVQETNDWVITGFSFESLMYTADWYIDYIKVIENPETIIRREKYYRPTPIEFPVSKVFGNHVVPNNINVLKDGVYKHFDTLEKDNNGNIYGNVTNALRSFGLIIQIRDGKYIGKLNDQEIVEVQTDGSSMTINGVSVPGSTYKNDFGRLMVSLNKLSKAFGYEAQWNEFENTIYIMRVM